LLSIRENAQMKLEEAYHIAHVLNITVDEICVIVGIESK
jgi:hypothetical protein